jgi:hypothetical protein
VENEMVRPAQIVQGIVSAILLFLGLRYMITPDAVHSITNLTADNGFGQSNIRAMGAPLIMLAIVGAIGAVKAEFAFSVPLPVYFLALIVTRIVTLAIDGSSPGVIKALIIAIVFFAATEFSAQVFKKAGRKKAVTE